MLQFILNNWFATSTFGASLIALGAYRTRQSVVEEDVAELKTTHSQDFKELREDVKAIGEDVAFIRGRLESEGRGRSHSGRGA